MKIYVYRNQQTEKGRTIAHQGVAVVTMEGNDSLIEKVTEAICEMRDKTPEIDIELKKR